MAAERNSPVQEPWLAGPMQRTTAAALAYPYLTLGLAVLLAVAALTLTGLRLGYKTSRLDLLDPNADYNRRWLAYTREFGGDNDAVIVVHGPGREQVVAVLDELADSLHGEDELFQAVFHRLDLSRIRAKGLHYLSLAQLQGCQRFVESVAPIVEGGWSHLNVASMAGSLPQQMGTADRQGSSIEAALSAERFAAALLIALQRGEYRSPWPEMPSGSLPSGEQREEYLLANSGRTGLLLLRLAVGENNFARGSRAIDKLRDRLAHIQQRHAEVRIGLTGLPVLENDEMRGANASMVWASLLSFFGVGVLFVAGFGGLRHALLANLVLLIGMAWAFGYATLAVGHLNILSVSFTVTLIGIGIDYGIHYLARYLHLRREGIECREALLAASRGVGPAIATGAITTAVAFFAAALTSFTGVAELGLIAGGGLLLCAVAELFVLPALLLVVDRTSWGAKLPQPVALEGWLTPILKYPRATLAISLGGALLLSCGLSGVWYDHNLLRLQSDDLDSVRLERELLGECQQSAWFAISVADSHEQLLALKEQMLKLPSVERTEEIASLLPAETALKRPIIEHLHRRLAKLPSQAPAIGVDHPDDLQRVLACLRQARPVHPASPLCADHLQQAQAALARLPDEACYARLASFQQQMADDLLARLQMLRNIAAIEPPAVADLPATLVERFVGRHGQRLLRVYGRGNLWEMPVLARFVAEVRSVDPQATGNPLQAYEASREMKRSYELAAAYALAVILLVLVLDFRNLRLALLAAAPLALGVLLMFSLLGLLNVPLNPANLIALPVMLGIGVDYGVHVVHEYAACRGPYRPSPSTIVAVVIDSLTTMVGFGSLTIATHHGLASLGVVLTLGVACCLFTSLVMLPAWLAWTTRPREPRSHGHHFATRLPPPAKEVEGHSLAVRAGAALSQSQ